MDAIALVVIKLRRLLRSRGRSADDADDLIQEAFLRLQIYCKDKPVEQLEPFLVRTALNLSPVETGNAFALQSTPLCRRAGPTPEPTQRSGAPDMEHYLVLELFAPDTARLYLCPRAPPAEWFVVDAHVLRRSTSWTTTAEPDADGAPSAHS